MISSAGTAALVQPTRRRSDRARAGLVISRELLSPQGRERPLTTPSEREFLKKVPPASPPRSPLSCNLSVPHAHRARSDRSMNTAFSGTPVQYRDTRPRAHDKFSIARQIYERRGGARDRCHSRSRRSCSCRRRRSSSSSSSQQKQHCQSPPQLAGVRRALT